MFIYFIFINVFVNFVIHVHMRRCYVNKVERWRLFIIKVIMSFSPVIMSLTYVIMSLFVISDFIYNFCYIFYYLC